MKRTKAVLLLAAAVLVLLAAFALDARLTVQEYAIDAPEIMQPVRLALVTDFHGCDYGPGAERLVSAMAQGAPDAVLLAGDIFDDDIPWDASEALVSSLAERWPCFYVTGNHEYWSGQAEVICRMIEAAGATVLNMDARVITLNGQRLSICGVPDPEACVYADAPGLDAQLARAMAQAEPGTYTVLLAHRPEQIEAYAAAGFDLAVSGHAHGGQVRVPGLVNGLYAPNQGWFPTYAGGLYRVGETQLVVSRGLARESTRLPRVFNRPELVIIELY